MASFDDGDDARVRLHAEQAGIAISKAVVGSVKVSTVTQSREETVEAVLADERAEVETIACGRFVDEMPLTRTIGETTIVPVVEEVLVVERRLFLKEEIHIRRTRVERTHRETVVLREQKATIEKTGEP